MTWDYAELSKAAKAAGGPEEYVNTIESISKEIGRAEGRSEMGTWIGLAAFGASLLTAVGFKVAENFKQKKAVSQEAVDAAKVELVHGIKDYDAAHPENGATFEDCKGDRDNQ